MMPRKNGVVYFPNALQQLGKIDEELSKKAETYRELVKDTDILEVGFTYKGVDLALTRGAEDTFYLDSTTLTKLM